MEIWLILNLAISIATIFGLVLVYLQQKKLANPKDMANTISTEVVAGLSQSQFQFLGQILDQINQNNTKLNSQLSQNLQQLEQRFGELQIKIQSSLSGELNKIQTLQAESKSDLNKIIQTLVSQNQLEFEKIKQDNQASLTGLQAVIQVQLEQAIKNLLEVNKSNFDLLSKTNQEKLLQIQGELDKRLSENLTQNLKSFEVVTKNLADMQGVAQKMVDSTSSIDRLNNIFERTAGKAFGSFGEKYLESLLTEYLNPLHWSAQAPVPGSSDKIDFIIEIGDQKIGIDCKFPVTKYSDYLEAGDVAAKKVALSGFLKAVVAMAQDIFNKYHKANFMDSLLIYFPSDSMFAEVVNDAKTMEALQKYKVNPASPTTIVPILAMIRQYEFKLKVQEGAEDIIRGLNKVRKNVDSFRDEFKKLGDKIRQAQANYDSADKNLGIVQKTVLQLEEGSGAVVVIENVEPLI